MNQKTLDTIIGKNYSEVINNVILLQTLSTTCYINDVSNKLNKNLSLNIFRVDWNFNFSASIRLDVETNSFTWLKMRTAISNLKLK